MGHPPSWFQGLEVDQQGRVQELIREAVEQAVFSFLALLDGASFIDDGPEKGGLELYYIREGNRVRLNEDKGEDLHDIFNA